MRVECAIVVVYKYTCKPPQPSQISYDSLTDKIQAKNNKKKQSMSSTAQLFKITALRALTHVFVRRSFIWFGQVEH